MNKMKESIKDCVNCNDLSYPERYLHYVYLDKDDPQFSCGKHPDFSRRWACITNPQLMINLRSSSKTADNKNE